MDWATFFEKGIYPLGVTVAILWGVGRFVTAYLWPLIEKQLELARLRGEQERLDRIAERDKFLASLAERDKIMKQALSKLVTALDRNTESLKRHNHERSEK